MSDTIEILSKILINILTAFYESFGFSILLSFLAMFFYLYACVPVDAGKGWKGAIVTWYKGVQRECIFQKAVFIGFRDFAYFVSNIVESESVDESIVQSHGRLGHLGDREW